MVIDGRGLTVITTVKLLLVPQPLANTGCTVKVTVCTLLVVLVKLPVIAELEAAKDVHVNCDAPTVPVAFNNV